MDVIKIKKFNYNDKEYEARIITNNDFINVVIYKNDIAVSRKHGMSITIKNYLENKKKGDSIDLLIQTAQNDIK